jgi:lipoprotein-releasing system permease protein
MNGTHEPRSADSAPGRPLPAVSAMTAGSRSSRRKGLPFELHIALRYLLAKRKQAFISVISFISTLGVTVGVMALVIALAMMTGLQQELRDRILGSNPHIYVWNTKGISDYRAEAEKLRSVPHVVGAAPAILGQGLVSAAGETQPLQVKGIDPALEQQVTNLNEGVTSGSIDALNVRADETDTILLGKDLAAKLGVTTGDSVSLTLGTTLSPAGLLPRTRRLRVAGLFTLGLIEFDSTYGFLSLDVAKRLLDKDQVDLIQLRVDDIYDAPRIAESISTRLGSNYVTQDWADMNKSLFSALGLEKIAISLTIGLIVIVAALNIVASLILLVMEKHRDIAILKTMGAGMRSVMVVFIMQGLIIGIVGTTVGASVGWALCSVLTRYKLIRVPVDVYQMPYVPFRVLPLDFALVVLSAIVICLLATIYPARKAAKLDPVQALRYE